MAVKSVSGGDLLPEDTSGEAFCTLTGSNPVDDYCQNAGIDIKYYRRAVLSSFHLFIHIGMFTTIKEFMHYFQHLHEHIPWL